MSSATIPQNSDIGEPAGSWRIFSAKATVAKRIAKGIRTVNQNAAAICRNNSVVQRPPANAAKVRHALQAENLMRFSGATYRPHLAIWNETSPHSKTDNMATP